MLSAPTEDYGPSISSLEYYSRKQTPAPPLKDWSRRQSFGINCFIRSNWQNRFVLVQTDFEEIFRTVRYCKTWKRLRSIRVVL